MKCMQTKDCAYSHGAWFRNEKGGAWIGTCLRCLPEALDKYLAQADLIVTYNWRRTREG